MSKPNRSAEPCPTCGTACEQVRVDPITVLYRPLSSGTADTVPMSQINDPTNWNPSEIFDELAFASNTDAKKAKVLFNRLVRERDLALRGLRLRCPAPVDGDDGTIQQCNERGHCGCDEAFPAATKVAK